MDLCCKKTNQNLHAPCSKHPRVAGRRIKHSPGEFLFTSGIARKKVRLKLFSLKPSHVKSKSWAWTFRAPKHPKSLPKILTPHRPSELLDHNYPGPEQG